MKKIILSLCFFTFSLPALFSMGNKDNIEVPVEKPEGFQEYIDINDQKKGKYNFYIEAKDRGGNTTIVGPHNIYIDPESDLPIVGFTNPRPQMRIPGNLNIVGTCVDDDAVAFVELMFNGDSTTIVKAEGADFWSYYLDTTGMEDGLYSITAWGVDVNGLKGLEKTVYWNLDRKKPLTQIESQELGQLVSGKLNLKGSIYDGNQISNLFMSLDEGKTYEPVKIDTKKKAKASGFSTVVDTKKFKDGPKVIWFKAIDKMGTVGLHSFLIYVDNTKPEVKIVFPEPKQEVNGIFSVAGYAKDAVGLKNLSWRLGKESGNFDLAIGNPWWQKTFDIRGQKTSSLELEIKAVDLSGNISIDKYKIPVNQNADLPVVSVFKPVPKEVFYGDTISFSGLVSDDDGVEAVYVSIDGKEALERLSTGSFQFLVSGIEPGLHSVSIWAKDIYGIIGPKLEIKELVVAGNEPKIELESLITGLKGKSETKDFSPGLKIHPEQASVLKLKVFSGSVIKKINWTFGSQAEQSLELKSKAKGVTDLTIPVPQNIDYGTVPFTISASDIYDRKGHFNSVLSVSDLSVARGDTQLVLKDARLQEANTIVLDANTPVFAYLLAGNAVEASLTENTNIINLKRSGNSIKIEAGSEYGSIECAIRVKSDRGFSYSSELIRFVNPAPAPIIQLENSKLYIDKDNAEKEIVVKGTVSAKLPLDSLQYKVYGPSSATALIEGDILITKDSGDSFAVTLPQDLPFGPLALEVQANVREEKAITSCSIFKEDPYKDPYIEDPKIKISPPAVQWFQGQNLYYFVNYQGNINSCKLFVDGKDYEVDNQERCGFISVADLLFGQHSVDLLLIEETAKTPKSYKFSAKLNRKPEKASISLAQIDDKDWEAGHNIVMTKLPAKQQIILKAIVSSDEAPVSAVWTIGNQKIKGSIKKISDSQSEVSIVLPQGLEADRLGIEVEVLFKELKPVKALSEVVIVRPLEGRKLYTEEGFEWSQAQALEDGTLLIEKDKALYGHYSGKAVKAVSLATESTLLDVKLEDGLVKLEGRNDGRAANIELIITDMEGWTYTSKKYNFLIDSQAPSLSITSPTEGQWLQNSFELEVQAHDANKILELSYSLDQGSTWLKLASEKSIIDLAGLEDGAIGVAVRAIDEAGRHTLQSFSVNKDTVAPAASFVVPVAEARVNGENTIGISIKEKGKLVKATYISPGGARVPLEPELFISTTIGTKDKPMQNGMAFEFEDASGNISVLKSYPFIIDQEMDLPIVEVSLPEENEVIIADFVISGVVYDDDKPAKVYYKIDGKEEIAVDCETGYSIPIALSSLSDNEHKVVLTPEDIYGVKGKSITRNFRVSLEEPMAIVQSPRFDKTVRGIVRLTGIASDNNGIDKVYVSLDNGNSFNEADGTTEWSYRFDSAILKDGTNVAFVKVYDKYGIEALYSSLINIDNTAPSVILENPKDGYTTVGPVFVSGRATDAIQLESLSMSVYSLEGANIPEAMQNIALDCDSIIAHNLDLSKLPDGLYNIAITAVDTCNVAPKTRKSCTEIENTTAQTLHQVCESSPAEIGQFAVKTSTFVPRLFSPFRDIGLLIRISNELHPLRLTASWSGLFRNELSRNLPSIRSRTAISASKSSSVYPS